jgi:hypothetical protein
MDNNDTSINQKPKQSDSGSVWFGLVLIILGIVFLAQRYGDFELRNWWALFILIPVFSSFASAIKMYQKAGKLHYGVWTTLYGGLMPLLVALMFLFDLDWGLYWPVFVIVAGFGMFLSGLPFPSPEDIKVPDALLLHRWWPFFIGLSGTLLGITFLGRNLETFDLTTLIPFENWWGIFILIAAMGGVLTGLALLIGQYSIWLVIINFAGAFATAMAGIVAVMNLDWNLMNMVAPVILILAGLALLVGFGGKKGSRGSDSE